MPIWDPGNSMYRTEGEKKPLSFHHVHHKIPNTLMRNTDTTLPGEYYHRYIIYGPILQIICLYYIL